MCDMIRRIEAITRKRGEVDATDECDSIVHDHELLVVAVERPLLRVEANSDLRAELERMAHAVDVLAVGAKERQRRTGPEQNTDLDAFGDLLEQRAQLRTVAVACERKVRGHVPPGEMNV